MHAALIGRLLQSDGSRGVTLAPNQKGDTLVLSLAFFARGNPMHFLPKLGRRSLAGASRQVRFWLNPLYVGRQVAIPFA